MGENKILKGFERMERRATTSLFHSNAPPTCLYGAFERKQAAYRFQVLAP
jgi:hypothetical protein